MAFEELKLAIMSGRNDAVVAELSDWSEAERKAAIPFLYQLIGQLHQPPGIHQDHNRNRAAELALFGVVGRKDINVEGIYHSDEAVAEILLNRRPAWLSKLIEKHFDEFSAPAWCSFFDAGLIRWDDDNDRLVNYMMWHLCRLHAETAERLFERVPQLREYHYRAPHHAHVRVWIPFIEQLVEAGELDRLRFLRACLTGLDVGFKRDHQQDVIGLIVCVNPTDDEWGEVLPELLSLLQHSSVTVLGVVVDRITAMFENETIDLATALPALAALFHVKQKKYAAIGLKMASQTVAISEHRRASVVLAAHGLQHPAADIQKKALKILADHLNEDDVEIIEQLKGDADAVAATLKPNLHELLNSFGVPAEGSGASDTIEVVIPSCFDFAEIEQKVAVLPEALRKTVHLDEVLSAARDDRIDACCVWPIMSQRVLANSQPIQQIQSLDELIDVVTAAIERLDAPDEWNRILDGLTRFAAERPGDFKRKTAALKKRLNREEPPQRGIMAPRMLYGAAGLLKAWIDRGRLDLVTDFPRSDTLTRLYEFIAECLGKRSPRQLLSTPTHTGGWIDPVIWVDRLWEWAVSDDEINNADFVLSALRLAPDNRLACLGRLEGLKQPWHDLAVSLLERDAKLAGDTEFPWPEGRIAYDWYPFAAASEFPFAIREAVPSDFSLQPLVNPANMYSMQVTPNSPTWHYPWLATLWPSSLLWYWQRAIESFVERMEYRTKSDEPHDQYLQPLFEPYRPLTTLSARVIWLATFSQGSSKMAAVDVWIELVSTGRADIELLSTTLQEVVASITIPGKRIMIAMAEVAAAGPLHAWTAAEIIQRYLTGLETLPRETAAFLEQLLEWLTQLGLPVSESFSTTLSEIGSGKAKRIAKQLLVLQRTESDLRSNALSLLLEARVSQAEASHIDGEIS